MRAFPISGPEPRPGTPVGNGAAPPKGVRAGPLPWAGSPKQGITPRGQGLNSTGAASLRWAPQRLRTPHTPSSPMWTFSEDNQRDQAPRTPDSGDGREQGLPPLSESPRVSEWRGHPELLPPGRPLTPPSCAPPAGTSLGWNATALTRRTQLSPLLLAGVPCLSRRLGSRHLFT